MALKGVKQTEEHKRKIGESNKISKKLFYATEKGKELRKKLSLMYLGIKNPEHSARLKGRKQTEEHSRKISEYNIRMGKKPPQATKEQRQSIEWRAKISNGLKGKKYGPLSIEHKIKIGEKQKGSNHWNWKGGISPENETIRHSLESKLWQESVRNRDCNCCQKCGENRISKLTAHHILNFSTHKEIRFAIDNGITFCRSCHKEFHMKYGFRKNSREQVIEFLKN